MPKPKIEADPPNPQKYPEQYLHVSEPRSGEEWVVPLRGNSSLDLTKQVKKWIKSHFDGECVLDGKIMPRVEGEYYAKLITDGRPPDTAIVWDSGGFYVELK